MTLQITIAGSPVTITEGSLSIKHRVDDKDTAVFTVRDDTGTLAFNKGQPVSITDASLPNPNLFAGYINKPTATNLYPQPTNLWSMDCVSKFYVAAKKSTSTSKAKPKRGGKHVKQQSGAIVANQIQQYLAPDGVTGNFALDWSELQTDWQTGVQSGVTVATNTSTGNVGAGDLELLQGGATYTSTATSASVPTVAAIAYSGVASSIATSPVSSRQIWSGSLLVNNVGVATLFWDVWISSTSPSIVASLDFTCSDGTIFSNTLLFDTQEISNVLTNDLSGLANDQWYTRDFLLQGTAFAGKTITSVNLVLAGNKAGTYNVFFKNIYLNNNGSNVFFFNTTLNSNNQAALVGYSNVNAAVVQAASAPSQQVAISAGSYSGVTLLQSSQVSWQQTVPNGCSLLIESSIDNQASWHTLTSGSAIPGLLPGVTMSLVNLSYRALMKVGPDPSQNTLGFTAFQTFLTPTYTATKTDLEHAYGNATGTTAFSAGTLSNTQVVSNQLTLSGFQRNYTTLTGSDQTQYSSGVGNSLAPFNKQMELQMIGTGDVRSRMDPAGQWQNFIAECDIQVPSQGNAGLVYRTTGWQNNNDTYAYVATFSTTQIQLGRGTNSSSGAGSFTSITTTAVSLTAGSSYRLKIVVNGNSHIIYLNGAQVISATDSTYPNAGYLGLRLYNNAAGTVNNFFNNFGVVSALSGTWQSASLSISSPTTYGNSVVLWDIDGIPDDTCSITMQSSVDGGSTFQSVTNGGAIPNLVAGQSLAAKTLILKATLAANSATLVPYLNGVSVFVLQQFSSSGTRSTAPLAWDSMTRGNVVGSFGTATNGATYTKSGTGTVALTSNEALISNTTGDVQMQIGTLTQQDTDETIRFELSASTISAGMELHFSDSSHYYRLVASTTALNVVRNAGGGNSTIATSVVTLTTNTFYRMRFRVVTSGLTQMTLYGRVWADGSAEPSTWNVTIADSPYKATVLADNPIRYYRLDDTNTTAIDIGSGAHNGTLHGTIVESQPGLLVGDTDTAMLFDGSTGYVSLPTTGLPTGAAAWTLEAWCQISAIPSAQFNAFLSMGNRASLALAGLYVYVTGGLAYPYLGLFGGANDMVSPTAMSLNTPCFVAASYDGTNTRLYMNGQLVAGPHAVTLALVQSFASISSDGTSPTEFFPGIIDEPAIYSTTLSAQQILNHYNSGIASGGFALFGNGTGTASFDTYRVTAYPDPSVSLLSAGRAVNSLVNWNGVFPNNTSVAVSTSLDNGTTWQPHSNPSDYIPTISTAAYYAAVRSNSPLAFYRLNEKTGLSVYDSSNNGNTGTITGGVTLGQVGGLQGVNEIGDTAMLFDGTSGYVALPSAVTTNSLTALSLECWLNITALPTSMNPRVLANSHTDADFHGFQMAIAGTSPGGFPTGSAGTVGFDIGNGSVATQINSTSQLVIGTWTYVVVTWDGSNLKLYWNGSLQSTVAFTGPISSTTSVINIGRNPVYAGDYFPGTVQGVALYSTALSASAITAHYNAATQATQAVYSDSFTVDTHTQYTQTNGTGGSGATWTWDTANSRVVAVGGSRALLVFNTFVASDIDLLTDWYQSENGGFIWRYTNANNYYELIIKDSSNGNTFTLNKMSAGTLTTLSTASIVFPVGTHHRCHLTMLGGVITAFLDENQILTFTDGSPLGAGQWGLRNDTGTSYCYLLQATPQAANISNLFLCVKQQLSTSDPTVTPQITDHQALVSDNTIGTGVTISSVDYRTTYVSDNIDDQNTQSNYWWNINNTGAVTFQPRNAANSPYILQSSDILIGTLPTVEYSGDLYRNQMVLKGVVQNSVFSQNFIGDGQSKTWNVANPISGVPTILLNGQVQSVGIQGVDTGKQFYYQLNSTSITQDNSGTVLRKDLDTLGVAYLGAIGIDFAIDNTGQFSGTISQAQMAAMDGTTGIVSAIEDVSSKNMDVSAATTYANQLLQRHGSIARTLTYDTLHNGLQIGQSLPVFIPQLNIFDSVFLIVEIGITVRSVAGGPQYVYHLTVSETAALSNWVKTFSKIMRSVTGTKAKA